MNHEKEWEIRMREAASFEMPKQLRRTFVDILVFGSVKDPVIYFLLIFIFRHSSMTCSKKRCGTDEAARNGDERGPSTTSTQF